MSARWEASKAARQTDLVLVLVPSTSADVRTDALQRLMIEAWERGWDDCQADYATALSALGIVLPDAPQRPADPVH